MRNHIFSSPSVQKLFIVLVLSAIYSPACLAQCIDRKKIDWSNDGLFYDYGYLCPAYFFSFNGDTAKKWNTRFENINIGQAPGNVLRFKHTVDQAITKHAGVEFFKNLKFNNAEVCYPGRLKLFKDSGMTLATLAHYKCRYVYNYSLDADSVTGYNINVGVTSYGKIVTPLIIPSKRNYKPIIKTFTYCQLIEIAKKAQKNIIPVDRISFKYDKKKQQFYWLISEEIVSPHEGRNDINVVYIDASDFNRVTAVKSSVLVAF
jgi:hypothetical protein